MLLHIPAAEYTFPVPPTENPLTTRRYDAAVVIVLLLLAALICALGAVPTITYGHDLLFSLDAGWRVLCGQRPHVDFFTGLGPLTPALVALGIKLAHNTASGIGYASAIAALVCSLWGYSLGRRRLPLPLAAIFAVFLFFLAATPSPIGEHSIHALSHAMYFTRWAFALLSIALIESLTPQDSGILGGISTGAVCAALFFLKLNMFFICAGLVAPSLVFCFQRRRAIGILIGAAPVTVFSLALMGFNGTAIWRDYRIVMAAKTQTARFLDPTIVFEYPATLLAMLALAALIFAAEKNSSLRLRIYPVVMALAVFCAGALALLTNWQKSAMPLNAVFALYAFARLNAYREALPPGKRERRLFPIVLVACASLFVLPLAGDVMRTAYACRREFVDRVVPRKQFSTASLRDFSLFGGPQMDGRPVDGPYLVAKVNDGIDLLNHNSQPGETVSTLEFFNPFNFAMQRQPSRGGADFMVYGSNFNDIVKPQPIDLIGTADIVMFPRHPNLDTEGFDGLVRNYGPYLNAHFVPVAQSAEWTLWRNRDSAHLR